MYERVIVPLDGSEVAEAALLPGLIVARRFGARLWLVTVSTDDVVHDRELYLKEVGRPLPTDTELRVLRDGSPGELVAGLTAEPGSLICMASHARRAVGQTILGSVAAEVVRRAAGPVLLVGPRASEHPATTFETLVVPVDGSRLAEAVLPLATEWARHLGMALHLVHVVAPDAAAQLQRAGIPADDVLEDNYLARVAGGLEDAGVVLTWEVLHHTHADAAIVDYAAALPASLIAMCTHGRTGLGLVTMGSVATKVLHESACPVLVLRPEGLDLV